MFHFLDVPVPTYLLKKTKVEPMGCWGLRTLFLRSLPITTFTLHILLPTRLSCACPSIPTSPSPAMKRPFAPLSSKRRRRLMPQNLPAKYFNQMKTSSHPITLHTLINHPIHNSTIKMNHPISKHISRINNNINRIHTR